MKKTTLLCLVLALSGCAYTHFEEPNGTSFTRLSIGTKQTVRQIKMKDGPKTFEVSGYSNDQTEVAAPVAEAAASAASLLP